MLNELYTLKQDGLGTRRYSLSILVAVRGVFLTSIVSRRKIEAYRQTTTRSVCAYCHHYAWLVWFVLCRQRPPHIPFPLEFPIYGTDRLQFIKWSTKGVGNVRASWDCLKDPKSANQEKSSNNIVLLASCSSEWLRARPFCANGQIAVLRHHQRNLVSQNVPGTILSLRWPCCLALIPTFIPKTVPSAEPHRKNVLFNPITSEARK